jgi:hypothetical protein
MIKTGSWLRMGRPGEGVAEGLESGTGVEPPVTLFAVGTRIAERPPHRSERAQFGHSAPTSGV